MITRNELYEKYQPTTWAATVVNAPPELVATTIARDDPNSSHQPPAQKMFRSIGEALQALEPLGPSDKLLVMGTRHGTSCLFANSFLSTATAYPAWRLCVSLGTTAVSVQSRPTTIASDERSGVWGAREITVRDRRTPFGREPVFGVGVYNDGGRWRFYRFGEVQPFEDQKAYSSRRIEERLTEVMLCRYCIALGFPIYEGTWYTGEAYFVRMEPTPLLNGGVTYQEARIQLRIDQAPP